jgi:hypothetical protein
MDSITLGILLGETATIGIRTLANYSVWLKDPNKLSGAVTGDRCDRLVYLS